MNVHIHNNSLSVEEKKEISEHLSKIGKEVHKNRSIDEKNKIIEKLVGQKRTKEQIKKMSNAKIGSKNPMYGRTGNSCPSYGRVISKESRKKQSDLMKGRYVKEKNPFYGKSHSLESRLKISKGVRANPTRFEKLSGPNASNWQGGKSFEPYPISFNDSMKRLIRNRDDYTCQLCLIDESEYRNKTGMSLSCHHIDYIKNNTFKQNLISLCGTCHQKTMRNREYWTSKLRKLLFKKYSYSINEQKTLT